MKYKMLWLPFILPLLALFALAACIRPVNPQGTPLAPVATVALATITPETPITPTVPVALTITPETPLTPTATVEPATATPVPTPTEVTDEVAEAELVALFAASVGLTTTQPPTNSVGLEGVRVLPLANALTTDRLWLAYTYGIRSFDPPQHHVLAIYQRQPGQWSELSRLLLDGDTRNPPEFSPDYVGPESVSQVEVEPTQLWIEVQGGAGAHSGIYGLYSFDSSAGLGEQVTGFSASPGAGEVRDLNADGVGEVLLNATDAYVFCYACGVRYVQYEVYRWTGAQMDPLALTTLPDAPADDLNNTLVDLAQRGLWKDALTLLDENTPLPTDNEILTWNAAYIRLNGEAKRDAIPDSPYPLLNELFYGDLPATVNYLREAGADTIFTPESPLILGTSAEGWQEQMADYILRLVEPQLADPAYGALAHFLNGWANYLKGDNTAALDAILQATTLAPDDELFAKSLDYLIPGEAIPQVTALANVNVRSGPGTANPIIGRLPAGTVAQITGRTPDGQDAWWQIVYPAGSDQRGWVSGNPQFTSVMNGEGVPVVE